MGAMRRSLRTGEEFRLDPTAPLSASEVAWAHYVQALNILFALFESALHTNRNIDGLFWIEPVGRTDVVRIRYDEHGAALSDAAFGPRTEMGLQRRAGHESVGARIDGIYDPRVIAAFMETKATFERAHVQPELWRFLDRFCTSWTTFHLGLFDSSVVVSWSLIERYLVSRMASLLSSVPVGGLHRGGKKAMKTREEKEIRDKVAKGESPMAGMMLSILKAHNEHVFPEILGTKTARDSIAHGGTSKGASFATTGLRACSLIAKEGFGVDLNNRLGANAHLGLTP